MGDDRGAMNLIRRAVIRASTRRCHGCDDPSYHTHHLTTFGRARYTDDRGAADILGIPIGTIIILGILALVDVKYNHGAALHGIGDLFRSIIPQNNGK